MPKCPSCRSLNTYVVETTHVRERLGLIIRVIPRRLYECRACHHRFSRR